MSDSTIDGIKRTYSKGDSIFIPKDAKHSAKYMQDMPIFLSLIKRTVTKQNRVKGQSLFSEIKR